MEEEINFRNNYCYVVLLIFNFNSQVISCMQALQAFFFLEVASIVTSMLINIIFLYNNFVEEDCGKTCYVTILVIFFFWLKTHPNIAHRVLCMKEML